MHISPYTQGVIGFHFIYGDALMTLYLLLYFYFVCVSRQGKTPVHKYKGTLNLYTSYSLSSSWSPISYFYKEGLLSVL